MLEAFVLGLVQGLGEFLPISSSGHLAVFPWLFGWSNPGIGFDVALHIGTLLAVFLYFRKDIWNLIKGFVHSIRPSTRNISDNIYQKLPWLIILATIPGAIFGKLVESRIEEYFHHPLIIASTLTIMGIVLYVVDRKARKQNNLSDISWIQAFLIGLAQAMAIIPGVSRSGATITAALLIGLTRPDAARFSFLLSIPIILAAGILELGNFTDGVTTGQLIVAMVTAAVSGYLAIKYLLKYISNHDFGIFMVYRIVFALVILGVFVIRG